MEDRKIIDLFWSRSERALIELAAKYGRLMYTVAGHILSLEEDREECVNDAYLGTWNSIPPQKPDYLKAFVCRITRNCALKRYRYNTADCRSSEFETALDELEQCLGSKDLEEEWSARELGREINNFLEGLEKEERTLFLRRYWFSEAVKDIADSEQMSENAISVRLSRTRKKLKDYLEKKGFKTRI